MSAREAYEARGYAVEYHNVVSDAEQLAEMLKLTKGGRSVPVILEGSRVTIGHGGT